MADYSDDRDMWVRNPYTQKLLAELAEKKQYIIGEWINGKYITVETNMSALMSVQILLEIELYVSSPEYSDYEEAREDDE